MSTYSLDEPTPINFSNSLMASRFALKSNIGSILSRASFAACLCCCIEHIFGAATTTRWPILELLEKSVCWAFKMVPLNLAFSISTRSALVGDNTLLFVGGVLNWVTLESQLDFFVWAVIDGFKIVLVLHETTLGFEERQAMDLRFICIIFIFWMLPVRENMRRRWESINKIHKTHILKKINENHSI